jgi:hypothetical protein
MASFSGAVRIGDLNDFIAPSQACVVSLNGNKLETKDEQEVGSSFQQKAKAKGTL